MTATDRDEPGAAPPPQHPSPSGGRRPRRRPPGAPAARFEPGRVAEPRHRNPTWIIAGVLLVLLSALGGVVLFTSSDDRTDVLVAARDLDPGRGIERADLRVQRVALDDGVASMPVAAADDIVGRHPIGRLPAGTMLSTAMLEAAVPLAPDEVVVGAALDPGEAPLSELEVGAPVELVQIDLPPPGVTDVVASATPLGQGRVWAVESMASGQLWVSMRVGRDVGLAASVAAAQDRLRLALIGGAG